jgi:hypothetical protein
LVSIVRSRPQTREFFFLFLQFYDSADQNKRADFSFVGSSEVRRSPIGMEERSVYVVECLFKSPGLFGITPCQESVITSPPRQDADPVCTVTIQP